MKKFFAIVLSLIMALSLVACGGDKEAEKAPETSAPTTSEKTEDTGDAAGTDVVQLAALYPLTGAAAYSGQKQLEGVQAYVDYVNENGGIKSLGGAKVELVVGDTAGKAETGVTELERIISTTNVVGILGPYNSNVGAATAPIAEKYKTPYILTNCTIDSALYDAEYVFRANHYNTANALAFYTLINDINAMNPGAITKVAHICENGEFATSMLEMMEPNWEAETGTEYFVEFFEPGTTDFSSILNKVKHSGADAIMVAASTADGILFTNQYFEYDMTDIPLLSWGYGMVTGDYLAGVGDKAENIIMMNGWMPDVVAQKSGGFAEFGKKFAEDYQARTGEVMSEMVAHGWMGCGVMINAIERAGSTDKDAIRQALLETDLSPDSIELVFHPYGVTFESDYLGMNNQNPAAACLACQVQDGEYKFISPASMVSGTNPLIWPQYTADGQPATK